jgi:hypothetical protein
MSERGWGAVSAAFAALGEPLAADTIPGFTGFWVPSQPTASFSPLVWSRPEPPDACALAGVAEYVRTHGVGVPKPYCCLCADPDGEIPAGFQAAVLACGWWIDAKPLELIQLSATIQGAPSAGEPAAEFQPLASDSELPVDFVRLVRVGFGLDDAALAHIGEQFAEAPGETQIISLRSQGEIAAVGAITVRGEWAFFTWGTISPPYRGKGLIHTMTRAARDRAAQLGARSCLLATRNPRVMALMPAVSELYICRKLDQSE